MNTKQRILILDAAITAQEHSDNPIPKDILLPLIKWLDNWMEKEYDQDSFDLFLKEQREAVSDLPYRPEVFGG